MAKKDATTEPFPSPDPLKQSIDAERAHLMQAHAVVKCLAAALMNSPDDDAMFYVDAANVAADLIDDAVAQLNRIGMGKGVKEQFPEYFRFAIGAGILVAPLTAEDSIQ